MITLYNEIDGDKIVRENGVAFKKKYPWASLKVGQYFGVEGLRKGYYPKMPDSLSQEGRQFTSTSVERNGVSMVMVKRIA